MDKFQILGALIAILLIVVIAIFSGTKLKKTKGKNDNGAGIVAGLIMGTLVGGSSTVGTAQLAYNFGMSAWWFTLGGGIGCLILTIFYAKPFRKSGSPTLVGMLSGEYGSRVGMMSSILSSIGTFINIISQLLAASAVMLVFLPTLGTTVTVLISAAIMALYVVFGGTKGAGMVGTVKIILLYVSMLICGMLALSKAGGSSALIHSITALKETTGINYFSLVARGASTDISACCSLILGILTTQTYAQAIISAKSIRASRAGGLISALLIPPIGIMGIIVGLYMRTITNPQIFDAKTALTQFIMSYIPGIPGGIILGTLFIASVGTGAGLALGIATIINNDIIQTVTKRFSDVKKSDFLQKILIIAVLLCGCCLSTGSLGDTILNFAFMSMGLRGAVLFIPLCAAIWLKGKIQPCFALASVIAAPIAVLCFGTVWKGMVSIDSIFIGVAISAAIMIIGWIAGNKKADAV